MQNTLEIHKTYFVYIFIEISLFQVTRGANIEETKINGYTALHEAAW